MVYAGLNVSITGATGFIGSSLAEHFTKSGANVYCFVKDELVDCKLPPNVSKIYGDVTDKKDIDYFIEKSKPDIFIHLAAQTQAAYSIKYPYSTIKTNIDGTLNILESLRVYEDCKSIIVASSDKTYGELESEEYTESHRLNGIYPYDASKSITDILCKSYKNTYGMKIVSIRHCNVYGPNDSNYKRIIPNIIKHFYENKEFEVRNGGTDIREYIHIEDVISVYDSVIDYIKNNENIEDAFNIGSGERFTSLEVVEIVKSCFSEGFTYFIKEETSQELKKQVMNYSLLNKKTGWGPKKKMKDSMPEIVNSYLNFLKGENNV